MHECTSRTRASRVLCDEYTATLALLGWARRLAAALDLTRPGCVVVLGRAVVPRVGAGAVVRGRSIEVGGEVRAGASRCARLMVR